MISLEPTLIRGIFTFFYFDYKERLIERLILIPAKKKSKGERQQNSCLKILELSYFLKVLLEEEYFGSKIISITSTAIC